MERLCEADFPDIRENYGIIRENIDKAMALANRRDEVRIMAVTKTVPPERVNFAVELGVKLLGENRVQEYLEKRDSYAKAEVHFIGGLQTNKVKYIIDKVSMIHSVDSVRLAEEIDRRAAQHGRIMDILAEINIGEEETKGGISAEKAKDFCGEISRFENVRLRGLMTIPPAGCGEEVFARMQELFETIKASQNGGLFDMLSMGMSGDYQAAVKYGATIVRIGSALFGQRKYAIH